MSLMKLTQEEFNTHYNALLKKFADHQQADMEAFVWRVHARHGSKAGKLLWLFLFVFTNWEHTDGVYNHISEDQLTGIISMMYRIQS